MTKRTGKHSHSDSDPVRPEPGEQSGSTGRDPGPPADNPGVDGKPGTGANTGQGTYGQSGYGQGSFGKGDDATPTYQKDVPGRDDARSKTSNQGSGQHEVTHGKGKPDVDRDVRGHKAPLK